MAARIAALLMCCTAVPALAQDSTIAPGSLPFRRGQWAAHFFLGTFTNVGVSRFRSPTRATLLQLSVLVRHAEASDNSGGTPFDAVTSSAGVTARLGWRAYRGSGRVTPYRTFGPLFTLSHSYTSNPGGSSETNTWSLGVFGDLGALYHVTEWLALGAAGGVDVRYSHSALRSSVGTDAAVWEIVFSGVSVTAGLTLLF